jgi:four helix bundle protein
MENTRKNKNRGYQQLRVWEDAIDLFAQTRAVIKGLPYDLRRASSQQIGSTDSVHRNIAEGYCRRSITEYLHFLNIALGSLGESVSGLRAFHASGDLPTSDFERLDALSYKLENGLLRLVESLEVKRERGDWIDHLMVRESNAAYICDSTPALHHSDTPPLQYSTTPPTQGLLP